VRLNIRSGVNDQNESHMQGLSMKSTKWLCMTFSLHLHSSKLIYFTLEPLEIRWRNTQLSQSDFGCNF
jgi:hypothetical protein